MSKEEFIQLSTPPDAIKKASIISINQHEFVAVPPTKKKNVWGIYKYSSLQNSWMKFIKYPKKFTCRCHAVTFNEHNQKLYIADSKEKKLVTVNINSHEFETHSYSSNMINGWDPDWPSLVNVNDTVHLIGGNHQNTHYVWNNNDRSWNTIYSFSLYDIRAASTIFIPSKQMILLVGGWNSGDAIKYIWKYSLLDKTWSNTGIKCPIIHHGMVLISSLSLDQHNIIILGSKPSELKYSDKSSSFILNINNNNQFKLIESNICCPINLRNGQALVIGAKNEILVEGFIKQLVNIIDPPMSIIQLIAQWCDRKMLHWIGCNNKRNFHWSIYIDCILSNT